MGGQCNIPELPDQLSYTHVAAGDCHTVLLRSDGSAVACGCNDNGQCNIPALDEQVSYTEVVAGLNHTVFLRSDGSAVSCGNIRIPGQRRQRWLQRMTGMGNRFAPNRLPTVAQARHVLQLVFSEEPDGDLVVVAVDL